MAGRATAVKNGDELVKSVAELGRSLGLNAQEQVKVARRIWGSERYIDVVLTDPITRKNLGLECKFQATRGTAEEKIPSTIQDIAAWPIPGLVVFAGDGFTENMRSFLVASGKAVEFDDLAPWLRLFFSLADPAPPPGKTYVLKANPVSKAPARESTIADQLCDNAPPATNGPTSSPTLF